MSKFDTFFESLPPAYQKLLDYSIRHRGEIQGQIIFSDPILIVVASSKELANAVRALPRLPNYLKESGIELRVFYREIQSSPSSNSETLEHLLAALDVRTIKVSIELGNLPDCHTASMNREQLLLAYAAALGDRSSSRFAGVELTIKCKGRIYERVSLPLEGKR